MADVTSGQVVVLIHSTNRGCQICHWWMKSSASQRLVTSQCWIWLLERDDPLSFSAVVFFLLAAGARWRMTGSLLISRNTAVNPLCFLFSLSEGARHKSSSQIVNFNEFKAAWEPITTSSSRCWQLITKPGVGKHLRWAVCLPQTAHLTAESHHIGSVMYVWNYTALISLSCSPDGCCVLVT